MRKGKTTGIRQVSSLHGAMMFPLFANSLLATGCASSWEETSQAAVVEEVEAAVWAFHAADTAKDAESVINLLWPEYTMLADGEWTAYEDVVAGSRAFMSSLDVFHTEWTALRITPLGPNAAVSSFQFRDSIVTKAGELIQNRGPTTLVWQRRNGEWRVIQGDADHYPLDR